MRSRSQVHMLTVAAARLEAEHANPKLIADLREAAGIKAGKRARGERATKTEITEDDKRIACQAALFNRLPNGTDKERLKVAMLQCAYDMLWDGNSMGCDALIEWLPSDDVQQMMDAWGDDQFGEKPRSKWYGDTDG